MWNGARGQVPEEWLAPYDLEAAQKQLTSINGGLDRGKDFEWLDPLTLERLAQYARAADQVIAAGRRELDRLQGKRSAIHSDEATGTYDKAIQHLRIAVDRHVRMKTRILHTLTRAQKTLADMKRKERADAQHKTPQR